MNGSLGFIPFGLTVPVYGNYTLQRALGWTYNSTLKAYTTQVMMMGKVDIYRYQQTATSTSTTSSKDTLSPFLNGSLTLLSPTYPGPGFTGDYGWFGDMDISPDPFVYWSDASTLLSNTSAGGGLSSHHKRRQMLESSATASTGGVPVRGPVTVKEWHNTDGSPPDDCSIMCIDGPGCAGNPCSAGNLAGSSGDAQAPTEKAGSSNVPATSNLIVVAAAVAGPMGLALCAVLAVLGLLAARRLRYKKLEEQKQEIITAPPDGPALAPAPAAAAWDSMDGPARRSSYAGNIITLGARKRSMPQAAMEEHILPKQVQGQPRKPPTDVAVPDATAGPSLVGQWLQILDGGLRRRRISSRYISRELDTDAVETLPDNWMTGTSGDGQKKGNRAGNLESFLMSEPQESPALNLGNAHEIHEL
eukprot:jgi/Chrzof1/2301/Cz11g10070.t1